MDASMDSSMDVPMEPQPGAYTVEVNSATRTIVITGRGRATTEDTVALIERNRQTFRDHPGFNVIYDSAGLDIESSAPDMVRVAGALFGGGGGGFGRFAVVVPEKRTGLAMMFTALAQTHGIDANVFRDRGDAWRWVSGTAREG